MKKEPIDLNNQLTDLKKKLLNFYISAKQVLGFACLGLFLSELFLFHILISLILIRAHV